ncbi:MAG: hypothetical protein V4580_01360 [Bacteroidota bacterium]
MANYTELIAKYINEELSETDKATFEKELSSNADLKKEYYLQLQIVEGAKRMGIKNQVAGSFKAVKTKKIITKALVSLAIIVAVVGAVALVNKVINKDASKVLYELNEQGNTNWSEADKKLESQVFKLNPLRDTIIETHNGIVFSIPAKAFLNKHGETPTETIDIEIKEAMTPSEIMRAGLSTTSNGQLLETGGMFYVDARLGDENLIINASKPLNVNVPVNNNKKDMMLFKGERKEDGSINWMDPKPLKKRLSTVNILKLNFYPEHFLDSLKGMGFDIKNKKLTDSIYYSFSAVDQQSELEFPAEDFEYRSDSSQTATAVVACVTSRSDSKMKIDTLSSPPKMVVAHGVAEAYYPEINPSRIKAIWNKKFNYTLLATKEFEERLKVIFSTCDAKILDLYIKNLNKDLYEIDSMASSLLSGDLKMKFLNFYARRDGGVEINDAQNRKLQDYFEEKRTIYADAVNQTLKKMYEQESKQDRAGFIAKMNHETDNAIRSITTFTQELEMNLDEAYRQLGKTRQKPVFITASYTGTYYSAPIIQVGWHNVDRYTLEATVNRTTLKYSDPESGKKAIIKYEPITVTVNKFKDYDRVLCYMIPDKLSSFQLMNNSGNVFNEKLNELMNYSIITIGFKGDKTFYSEIKQAKSQVYAVDLKLIKASELDKKLNQSFPLNQQADILKDINYQLFDLKETVRANKIKRREEVRNRLYPIVFPCMQPEIQPAVPNRNRVYVK